jgi:hypothetical protein
MATSFRVRGLGAQGELLECSVHAGNREEAARVVRSIGLNETSGGGHVPVLLLSRCGRG